jgi:redox-sensitive bicupin YhaK (pirin superfamily)
MAFRTINQIIEAKAVQMGDITLDQALPMDNFDHLDPFLLIHHWKTRLPGNQRQQEVGVGPHPHRGFSPVTFIYEGSLRHQDSRGNDQVVFAGGTQWMHSGMGIIHSERPDIQLAQNGGPLEIIQFWVNVPSASKMIAPSYQPLDEKDTPMVPELDPNVRILVVAGTWGNITGPIRTESPLFILRMTFLAKASVQIPVPDAFNGLIYNLSGSIKIGEAQLGLKTLGTLHHDGHLIGIDAQGKGEAILLSGKPINEPIVSQGPFVVNTQSQFLQAMRDYQMGKMGFLVENFDKSI